jgi:hypothetical protein
MENWPMSVAKRQIEEQLAADAGSDPEVQAREVLRGAILAHDVARAEAALAEEAAQAAKLLVGEAERRVTEYEETGDVIQRHISQQIAAHGVPSIPDHLAAKHLSLVGSHLAVEAAKREWQTILLNLSNLQKNERAAAARVKQAARAVLCLEAGESLSRLIDELERKAEGLREVLGTFPSTWFDVGSTEPGPSPMTKTTLARKPPKFSQYSPDLQRRARQPDQDRLLQTFSALQQDADIEFMDGLVNELASRERSVTKEMLSDANPSSGVRVLSSYERAEQAQEAANGPAAG